MGRYTLTAVFLGTAIGFAALGTYYFAEGELGWLEYACMLGMSLLFVVMSLYFMRSVIVSVDDGGIRIRSPFIDALIPMSSISSAEFRQSFSPGIRVYGYGTFRKASGIFRNSEFGNYRVSIDTSISAFVVVRYGEDKVIVFNSVDSPTTYNMYSRILSGTSKD